MSMLLAMQDDHLLEDGIISPVNKLAAFNGVGLRAPLMDHKLFEFMLGVPDHLRRHGKRRKILLRNYVDRMLPGLVQAPPRENPVGGQPSLLELCMTRGPLREMLETCLSETSIRKRGLMDPEVVRRMLTEAKAGETLPMRQVFSLLGLELWFRIFIDHEKGWISS
jgi:asparagine synthase (glutamine-hydrolysing)